MDFTTIEYLQAENIGIIRLNRPHRMNAVIEEMYIEIQQDKTTLANPFQKATDSASKTLCTLIFIKSP